MKIKKRIETRVNIAQVMTFFSTPDALMRTLADDFEGRCHSGCLVLTVDNILRQSECTLEHGGAGGIDVIFEVTALVFEVGEIITNCTILHRSTIEDNDFLIGENNHCSIIIAPDKVIGAISPGYKIPVMVAKAKYPIGSTKVGINSTFIHHNKPDMYYKLMPGEALDMAIITEAWAQLVDAPRNTKGWEFFDALTYAYAVPREVKGVLSLKTFISDFAKYEGSIVGMPKAIRATTGDIVVTTDGSLPVQIFANNTAAVVALISTHAHAVRVVAEMVELYNTPEVLKNHAIVWIAMRHVKLP